jgi:hypothetical protein
MNDVRVVWHVLRTVTGSEYFFHTPSYRSRIVSESVGGCHARHFCSGNLQTKHGRFMVFREDPSIVPSVVGVGVPMDVSACSSCLVARRVAVRLGPLRPRTGRHVSGILVLWVGRLRARAPNCRPPTFSSFARRETTPWATLGFLCCVPIAKVSMSLVSLPPSSAPRGRGTDEKSLTRAPLIRCVVVRIMWFTGTCSWSRMRKVMLAWDLRLLSPRTGTRCLSRTTIVHGSSPAPARDAVVGPCCGLSARNATWLILPVVICLSQRLSHACVSMN